MTHSARQIDSGAPGVAAPATVRVPVARWVLVVGAAGFVQAFVLYYAFHYGVLSGLIQWDDCSVVLRGISNLDIVARAHSAYAMLRSIPYLSIHAPLSDVQAMLGLLVSGGAIWGPFVLNVVPILLALYAILFRPGRLDGVLFAALLILVLVQPLTINALTYIKSDWKGGVLIAAAVFALNESAERGSRGIRFTGAALLGLGLTSKLTAFYYPLLAIAILIAFEVYGRLLALVRGVDGPRAEVAPEPARQYGWRDARDLLLCIAIAVLPYTLFFLVYLGPTLTYIDYALGAQWTDGFTPVERLAYYSPASLDGAAAWGNLHLLFGLFATGCIIIAVARKTYHSLLSLGCVLFIAALFLAPLIVARTSNITFAAGFFGVVLGGTLIAVRTLARAFPRWGAPAALIVTVPLVLRAPLPFSDSAYGEANAPHTSELRELESTYSRIVSVLEGSNAPRPRVLVFYDDIFAPHPNLSILHFQRTSRLLSLQRVDYMSDLDSPGKGLADADFALTFVVAGVDSVDGRTHGLNWRFPVSAHPAVADTLVARQPGFEHVEAFPVQGGEIHLYRHLRGIDQRQSRSGGASAPGANRAGER